MYGWFLEFYFQDFQARVYPIDMWRQYVDPYRNHIARWVCLSGVFVEAGPLRVTLHMTLC